MSHTRTLCTVDGCVDDDEWGNPLPDGSIGIAGGSLTFLDPRTITLPGQPGVLGDTIVVLPESPLSISSFSSMTLLAVGIPQIVITNIHVRIPTCVPPPGDLVLWLPFDETSGTTSRNLAAGGNDGTQIGGPSGTSGFVSNSLCFNGSSQWVTVPDYPAIDPGANQGFTLDAWVKRPVGGPNSPPCVILDKRDPNTGVGYSLSVDYGHLILTLSGNNYADTVNIVPADGNWHYVAVSVAPTNQFSSSAGEFYIDGYPPVAFSPSVPGSLASTAPFIVGMSVYPGNQPWDGCLDEVEMFGRALATSEIESIYRAGSLGKCKFACCCVPAPANLVLWLPFDETSGTTSENLAAGGNSGTRIGGPSVTSGFVSNSLCFNGSSQFVTVPDYAAIDPGANQNFTVDAWVKRAVGGPNSPPTVILDKRDPRTGIGYSLAVSYGNLIFQLADSGGFQNYASLAAIPPDGNWHFVAVSVIRNQTNGGQFYVDGVPTAVFDPTGHPGSLATTAPFQVAASPVGGNQPWDGCIDEVEMFERALAASEIQTIYNAGSAGKCKPVCCCVPAPTNLVLWLPFDETSGTTSANLAAGGNNGTHIGGPAVISGFVDNSLCFNGSSQWVTVPDYPAIDPGANQNFTVDAWVKRAVGGPNSPPCIILDKRDPNTGIGYSLSVDYGNLIFQLADSGGYQNYYSLGAIPPDGDWHFVAVSVIRNLTSGGQFYVDGNAAASFDPTGHPGSLATTAPFQVAASVYAGGNQPWDGCIDEVEMFERALAASEIKAIYNAGSMGKCKPPCLSVSCSTNKSVQCGSNWQFDLPLVSSCCSNVTILPISTVTNGVCPKLITRDWAISDSCGHSNTCSQTVTVVDTTPPLVFCPTNTVIVALNSNCQLVIPAFHPRATDNCTPASQLIYSQSPPANSVVSGHSQLVTITVTDLCGNSSVCHVLVVGLDKTGPVVFGPASITVTNCLVPCVQNLLTVMDNCCPPKSLKITQSPPCNTVLGPGINSITVTVTDCNGNSTTKVIALSVAGPDSFLGSLYDTGNNNPANAAPSLLANGTVDPHYSLTLDPAGTTDVPGPNTLVAVSWPWDLTDPLPAVSKWISPSTYNTNTYAPYEPGGGYTNVLASFTLPSGANPSSASISGRWANDNYGAIFLNGHPVSSGSIPSTMDGFRTWTPFTISGAGLFNAAPTPNTLSFVVTNISLFTGLRVEFTNALVNCFTCAPPVVVWLTPGQTVPQFGVAVFHVNAGGTPPLTYQWYHNGVPLSNNGHDSGVTTPTLAVFPLNLADAGIYSVIITGPCGRVANGTALRVIPGWPWPWAWWNIAQLANPLAATVGPDLILAGTNSYAITAGSAGDFGLPSPGGQNANVVHVPALPADTTIQLPLVAPPGSNSLGSYSVVMDIYEPDTSLGTPSTLFQNIACCVSNLGSSGQDGISLQINASNHLVVTGTVEGIPINWCPGCPPPFFPTDAWNRVAMVVDDPSDGVGVNISLYLNGQLAATITQPITAEPVSGLAITWETNTPPPTLLSSPTGNTAELYSSGIQFHAVALGPDVIAGLGSPANGPIPADLTDIGQPPALSVSTANGVVNLSWTGSTYVLQETTDVTSDDWADSTLPFTEAQVNGDTVTTAVLNPITEGSAKFYRLIFAP